MTVVRCKTCGKVITRYKEHIGKGERLRRIRKHYQKKHPKRFKKFAKTRIKKSGSIPTAMLIGLVKKYKPEIKAILRKLGE